MHKILSKDLSPDECARLLCVKLGVDECITDSAVEFILRHSPDLNYASVVDAVADHALYVRDAQSDCRSRCAEGYSLEHHFDLVDVLKDGKMFCEGLSLDCMYDDMLLGLALIISDDSPVYDYHYAECLEFCDVITMAEALVSQNFGQE